jgi:hypothetical protein
LRLPANLAVILVRSLFPEGMFHMFTGAEYVLMNSLQPVGELGAEDKFFWLECLLAGAQKSRYINEGIAHPLENFNWGKVSNSRADGDVIAGEIKAVAAARGNEGEVRVVAGAPTLRNGWPRAVS